VEEVDDDEVGGCRRWAQEFNGTVEELGEGKTLFEEIQDKRLYVNILWHHLWMRMNGILQDG